MIPGEFLHPPRRDRELRLEGSATPPFDLPNRHMTIIQPGSKSPSFELDSHKGDRVGSAAFAGKKNLLLVFYPLDFTPT